MPSNDQEPLTFNERLLALVERLEAVADAVEGTPPPPKPDLQLVKGADDA